MGFCFGLLELYYRIMGSPEPYAPKPQAVSPKFEALNPEPSQPKFEALNPEPHKPSLNPKPQDLSPKR